MENNNRVTLEDLYKTFEQLQEPVQEQPSALDEFMYGFDKSRSFTENLGIALEAKIPIGELQIFGEDGIVDYKSPDKLYGEGFSNLSVDDRRKVLLTYRNQQLRKEYPELSQLDDESIATKVGSFIGPIVDPTTLTPIGRTLPVIAGTSGALGFGYSIAEDLALTDEVNLGKAVKTGAITATGGLVIGKIGQVVSRKLKAKRDFTELQSANEKVDQIQNSIDDALLNNVPKEKVTAYVKEKTGFTTEDMIQITAKADRKPIYREPVGYNPGGLNRASIDAMQKLYGMTPKQKAFQTAAIVGRGTQNDITVPGNVAVARVKNPILDNLLGNMSSTVSRISKPLGLRLRQHEQLVHTNIAGFEKRIKPLADAIKKVPKTQSAALKTYLSNGNFDAASKMLEQNYVGGSIAVNEARGVFSDILKQLKEVGYDIGEIKNYFPRAVKDYDELLNYLDAPRKTMIQKALRTKAKQLGVSDIKDIPEQIRDDVVNKVVGGYVPIEAKGRLSFTKSRKLPEITEEMSQFYYSPVESMARYVRAAANDIERRRFFGKNAVNLDGSKIDIDASIGRLLNQEIDAGRISYQDADRLAEVLQARFGLGEKAPAQITRTIRNLGYGTTLADPISALTQIKDIGISAYVNGMRHTIAGAFGKKQITMQELGLDSLIAEELGSVLDSSTLLHKALTYTGFRHVDRFGKNTFLNASLRRANKLSKTESGVRVLANKYKEAFGDAEFSQLINELKSGEMSDRVKLYVWSELSDTQPISLSEMPISYARNPNGRILFALKSFAIKQLVLLRNTIFDEYQRGNKKQAGINLLRYLAIVPLAGATVDEVKDGLLGRGFELKDIATDNAYENLFALVGANRYVRDRYLARGDVEGAVINTLAPPLGYMNSVVQDIKNLVQEGDKVPEKTFRELPGAKILYNYYGGGLENWEKWNKD